MSIDIQTNSISRCAHTGFVVFGVIFLRLYLRVNSKRNGRLSCCWETARNPTVHLRRSTEFLCCLDQGALTRPLFRNQRKNYRWRQRTQSYHLHLSYVPITTGRVRTQAQSLLRVSILFRPRQNATRFGALRSPHFGGEAWALAISCPCFAL